MVDVPSDDSAAALLEKPDDAVDVAITSPDAYASLLDVAVAHIVAIAHALADVAVAVASDEEKSQLELAGGSYFFHSYGNVAESNDTSAGSC